MKTSKTLMVVLFSMLMSGVAFSADNLGVTSAAQNEGLLRDIKELTLRCVVEPYIINARGEKMTGPLKSVCNEIYKNNQGGVTLNIDGEKLHAFLVESENSDGGDLSHLFIADQKGDIVAERKNIMAFDEIFIALAGGEEKFRQVRED